MTSIRVLLADDHGLVRSGIRTILEQMEEIEVVGEASNGREVLRMLKQLQPDVVVMDISMAELNGLDATAYIVQEHPHVRVLILTMHAAEPYVLQAVRSGAAGYLLKTAGRAELEQALHVVARGETYLTPAVLKYVTTDYRRLSGEASGMNASRSDAPLRPRERELLQLIAEGHSTKEIAARLHLSPSAVDSRRVRLMDRLDIHDMVGLLRYAMHLGLVAPEP